MPFKLVPAISEQVQNVLIRNKDTLNDHALDWWQKSSLFEIDSALLSAYYLYMRCGDDFNNFRQQINFPSDKLFIIDSGGYEILSRQNTTDKSHLQVLKNLDQLKVLRIQEAVADIGFILDRPPFITTVNEDGSKEFLIHKQDFFDSAKEFTANNTHIALANRSPNSKLKLYGVLQGYEHSHLEDWYNTMKQYPVDGWALAPKPLGDYFNLAMYISFVLERGITVPLHFLGSTNFNCLALIIYLLRKDKNNIPYYPSLLTADSTSHDTGAKYRRYNINGSYQIIIGQIEDVYEQDLLTGRMILKTAKNSQTIPLDSLPCDCPICQNTTPDIMRSASNTGSIAVSLHNLYLQKSTVKILTSLIAHPETYKDYVLSSIKNKSVASDISRFFTLIDDIIAYKRNYTTTKTSWLEETTEAQDLFA